MHVLPVLHKRSILSLERHNFLIQVSIDGIDVKDSKMRWSGEGGWD